MSKTKIILDFFINILATCIPIFVIQIIILPLINNQMDLVYYGNIITCTSLISTISVPFGIALNNTRLLKNSRYEKDGESGDFNLILVFSLVVNSILVVLSSLFMIKEINIIDILFMILISVLTVFKDYMYVAYRLNLNYKSILINNLFMSVGYFLGYLLFLVTKLWYFIYLIGYIFSAIHILKTTKLYKEPIVKTKIYKSTRKMFFILLLATFLSNSINYIDKLILNPLLGEAFVAIYFASTIFGKIVAQVISPINNVVLSYINGRESISKRDIFKVFMTLFVIGCIGYIIGVSISRITLNILYSNIKDEALRYVPIATISVIISMIYNVLNTFVLKYKKEAWQVYVSLINLILYVLLTLIFYYYLGFYGFYLGVLLSNIFRLMLIIAVFLFNFNGKKEDVKNEV